MARKAGNLFTRPFRSARERALAAPTLGAEELELNVDGTPIHAYVWGDPHRQPYVLFAHGWSSYGTRVAPWLKPLQDAGYAVVAFDQAAHGRSGGTHTTLPDFTSICSQWATTLARRPPSSGIRWAARRRASAGTRA
jgi:alpha-beta hydrolase superfamily lysophospholipase